MPIDKHIYNNNQSLNVQNTCCKSTILLPDSISASLNPVQVDAALRKSGLISNGSSGREIYLVYAIINNYTNIFL